MIIFGFKRIELHRSVLALPCKKCGYDHQSLQIYRNFFSIYFLPIIPLWKKGVVNCPNCSTELKKKVFFKQLDSKEFNHEAKHYVDSAFKSAKTPFYWLIAPLFLMVFIMVILMMGHHANELSKEFLSAYREKPFSNVIAVSKSPEDAYPYFITYVPEIRGPYVVIFAWQYSYESLEDAKKGVQAASKSLKEGRLKDHFTDPYLVLSEHFQLGDIVHVDRLEQLGDWKQYVPIDDPEGILKLFDKNALL